jgi:nicotinamidase-related amidase
MPTSDTPAQPTASPIGTSRAVYILITQCLQNSFFMEEESRLCLPKDIVAQMLVGSTEDGAPVEKVQTRGNRREVIESALKNGPLYRFLQVVVERQRSNPLHVIHIKDWHEASENYDRERRLYGAHCEAGTWGAAPLEGFEGFLMPWGTDKADSPQAVDRFLNGFKGDNNTTYYEVRSDTLFDLQPDRARPQEPGALEQILNRLILKEGAGRTVYVVVIGVYTDIKVQTLLTALRSRYHINNLITSDVLTASTTLERHLAGLDYADKVLGVEVIHSLNSLANVLREEEDHADHIKGQVIQSAADFRQYRTYWLDKQNVLSFQDNKLAQYVDLTADRARKVYQRNFQASMFLVLFGYIMLVIGALSGILAGLLYAADPERYGVDIILLPLGTGGLGLTAIVANFVRSPLKAMQGNLIYLVRLRNYLETYSSVTALIRHHFTTPEFLNDSARDSDPDKALERIERQMGIIQNVARTMALNFRELTASQLTEQEPVPPTPAAPRDPDQPPAPQNFSGGEG